MLKVDHFYVLANSSSPVSGVTSSLWIRSCFQLSLSYANGEGYYHGHFLPKLSNLRQTNAILKSGSGNLVMVVMITGWLDTFTPLVIGVQHKRLIFSPTCISTDGIICT